MRACKVCNMEMLSDKILQKWLFPCRPQVEGSRQAHLKAYHAQCLRWPCLYLTGQKEGTFGSAKTCPGRALQLGQEKKRGCPCVAWTLETCILLQVHSSECFHVPSALQALASWILIWNRCCGGPSIILLYKTKGRHGTAWLASNRAGMQTRPCLKVDPLPTVPPCPRLLSQGGYRLRVLTG